MQPTGFATHSEQIAYPPTRTRSEGRRAFRQTLQGSVNTANNALLQCEDSLYGLDDALLPPDFRPIGPLLGQLGERAGEHEFELGFQ